MIGHTFIYLDVLDNAVPAIRRSCWRRPCRNALVFGTELPVSFYCPVPEVRGRSSNYSCYRGIVNPPRSPFAKGGSLIKGCFIPLFEKGQGEIYSANFWDRTLAPREHPQAFRLSGTKGQYKSISFSDKTRDPDVRASGKFTETYVEYENFLCAIFTGGFVVRLHRGDSSVKRRRAGKAGVIRGTKCRCARIF